MSARRWNGVLVAALMALSLGPGTSWAIVGDAHANQTVNIFRNTSGSTLTSGTSVVYNFTASDSVTGTSKGAQITIGSLDVTTTTRADDRDFAGVQLDDTCPDGSLCRYVTEGVALARFACGTDRTDSVGGLNGTVGTTAVAGLLGGGSGAGFLLSKSVQNTSDLTDNCLRWVRVDRSNSR